jgi:hypothetical protein
MAWIGAIPCLLAATALDVVAASLARLRSISEGVASGLASDAANRILGEWPCRLRQGRSGQNSMFNAMMGSAEPFLFAGQRGRSNQRLGSERLPCIDLTAGALSRW